MPLRILEFQFIVELVVQERSKRLEFLTNNCTFPARTIADVVSMSTPALPHPWRNIHARRRVCQSFHLQRPKSRNAVNRTARICLTPGMAAL
jgi:hypothetical protein